MLEQEKRNEYVSIVKKIYSYVYTEENLKKRQNTILKRDSLKKIYSRGGTLMRRGYFSPSLIHEILVANVSRGKLLKKTTSKEPDYCYYFDGEDLVLVQSCLPDEVFEWITRESNIEYSIGFPNDDCYDVSIIVSVYLENKIAENIFLFIDEDHTYFELSWEKYNYDLSEMLVSATEKRVSIGDDFFFEDIYNLDFVYDVQGTLEKVVINGWDDEDDLVPISSITKELITGKRLPAKKVSISESDIEKKVKKIMNNWCMEGIFDIYAVSIFVNHDGDEITNFSMSYNLEEEQEGEERWNYAYWNQKEEDLQVLLKETEVSWQQLLNLLSKALEKIQKEQYLDKLFGRNIAIIIHGYEYGKEDIEATKIANPNGQADEFLKVLESKKCSR